MKYTTNYNLRKPDRTDNYNVEDSNVNMDEIDTLLKTHENAIEGKVNKEEGKGLSTQDYTTADKDKLSGIEEGANKTLLSSAVDSDSEDRAATPKAVKEVNDILIEHKAETVTKGSLVYNVKDFGAIGDGETDDTLAIQSAINFCGEAGGGSVLFPPGTYLSGLIKIKHSHVYLVGSGIGATKIIMKKLNDAALFQFGDYNDLDVRGTLHSMGICDMEVDGNKTEQSQGTDSQDGTGIGVRAEDVNNLSIRRMKVHNCDGYGLGIVGTGLPNRTNLLIEDVESHNNNYDGLDIKAGFENIWIQRLKAYSNGPGFIPSRQSYGIDVRGEHIFISDCLTYDNADSGLNIRELYALKQVDVSNLKSFGNAVDGARIEGSQDGNYVFTSCYFYDNARHGASVGKGTAYLNSCISNENTVFGIWIRPDEPVSAYVSGGSVSYNGQDGISTINNDTLNVSGTNINNNGRRGISAQGTTKLSVAYCEIEGNGVADRTQGYGIVLNSMINKWSISGCRIYDEETVLENKNQRRGLQFSGSSVEGILTSNVIQENWESAIGGTIPSGAINANNLT